MSPSLYSSTYCIDSNKINYDSDGWVLWEASATVTDPQQNNSRRALLEGDREVQREAYSAEKEEETGNGVKIFTEILKYLHYVENKFKGKTNQST